MELSVGIICPYSLISLIFLSVTRMQHGEKKLQPSLRCATEVLTGEVTLIIDDDDDEEITCEREILLRASLFFQGLFNSQMLESQADTVSIKDVSASVFKILVKHAQTGEISLHFNNVYDVLTAASRFQFPDIILACERYLTDGLDSSNCLSTTHVADICALENLHQRAKSCSLWYFNDVIQTEDFFNLRPQSVQEYLSEYRLNVDSELQIFDALMKWTEFDRVHRLEHSKDLFSVVVTLSHLTEAELQQVASSELVRQNNSCMEHVRNAFANRSSAEHTDHVSKFLNLFKNDGL